MQQIREAQSNDLSQNLKNIILGPFPGPFDPKTSKQSFYQKNHLVNFRSIGSDKKSEKFH